MPWKQWVEAHELPERDVEMTTSHLAHCQCGGIEKGQRLLGYQPRYTTFDAVREAVEWLVAEGEMASPQRSMR